MEGRSGSDVDPASAAVVKAVRRHLAANGLARKYLIHPEKGLSESTVNKFFLGEFSEATLAKIETVLGTEFRIGGLEDEAPTELGGYTLRSVAALQGVYLFVRPLFGNPTVLNAYIVDIAWDKAKRCLSFWERERPDTKHTQSGVIYSAAKSPFWSLVTINSGDIRTILVSNPDDEGLARGIILTTHNPKGALYIPVAAPVFLRRVSESEKPSIGYIGPDHPAYAEYQGVLASVTADDFGHLVSPMDRRRGMTVVDGSRTN